MKLMWLIEPRKLSVPVFVRLKQGSNGNPFRRAQTCEPAR